MKKSNLRDLYDQQLLSLEAYRFSLRHFDGSKPDSRISFCLLVIGTLLTLSGIIFFFAYNWANLTAPIKFLLVESLLGIAVVIPLFKGFHTGAGRAGLCAATVLIGVFLAVFGQIYQIGADRYELFGGWALLSLPWVILGNMQGLWLFWIGLLNLTSILYYIQVIGLPSYMAYSGIFLFLTILNGSFLVAREMFADKGFEWLHSSWPRDLLLVVNSIIAAIPPHLWIVQWFQQKDPMLGIAALEFFGLIILAIWFYTQVGHFAGVAIPMLAFSLTLVNCTGYLIAKSLNDVIFTTFLITIICLIVFSSASYFLKQINQLFNQRRHA